jgi:hypothetical protein
VGAKDARGSCSLSELSERPSKKKRELVCPACGRTFVNAFGKRKYCYDPKCEEKRDRDRRRRYRHNVKKRSE